jgi:purine-binding chemotaxis protein CheW
VSGPLAPAELEPIEPMADDRATPHDEAEAELAPSDTPAPVTTYHLVVNLDETDWRAVRAFQTWLVAEENGTIIASSPSRAEIERQEVGPLMEMRFASALSVEQLLAALDEVPEIVVAELAPEGAGDADAAEAEDDASVADDETDDLLAALQAELTERTTAREAGLMPAFEGPREVIGNAINENAHLIEGQREPVAPNGHPNGHPNGGALYTNGNGPAARAQANLAAKLAAAAAAPPPVVPPTEAPVSADAVSQSAAAPTPPAETSAPAPRAEETVKKAEAKARPSEEQMVVLDVGEESYGIPVQRVREIIRVPPITRVPNGPAFLEGVVNLRGQVIPVMDLRKHLGVSYGHETKSSRVVVSELGRHTVGLMVDGVSEVVMVATGDIEPPPALVAGVNDGQVCGVARLGDRLVLFLDPDRVLPTR